MVDLALLSGRARRASEWGRVRKASRIAVVVLPFVVVSIAAGNPASAVIGIGVVLLGLSVGLGWRSAEGARAARSGLALGAIPLVAGLVTLAIEGWRAPDRAITVCGVGCLLAGFVAGAGSAWYAMRTASPRRLVAWSQIGLVASLTTALGCIGLGLGSALAVIGAVLAGAVVGWVPARAGA